MEVENPQPDWERWRKIMELKVRRWITVDVGEESDEEDDEGHAKVRKDDGVDTEYREVIDEEVWAENWGVEDRDADIEGEEQSRVENQGAFMNVKEEEQDPVLKNLVKHSSQEQKGNRDSLEGSSYTWTDCNGENNEGRGFTGLQNDEKRRNSMLAVLKKGELHRRVSAISRTNRVECEKEEEEMSSEDEEERSSEEGADSIKIYCKDDHHVELFRTLTAFKDSSLLADLTLRTYDGTRLRLHSSVMATVSTLVKNNLKHCVGEGEHRYSISLGPDVDFRGLEGIVEFAYTGLISRLKEDNVAYVEAAAQTLGAQRVLHFLCKQKEKSFTATEKENEGGISDSEQLAISLHSIRKLWVERVGCDVVLEAIGASLPAHRIILAASSDFFRGMFSSGMKESTQSHIALPFLSASDLEALVGSSYSGALPLSWSCAFEISSTSIQLQYQPALSLSLDFLQQELNPYFCLDVVSFARAYQLAQLLEVAEDYVLRQFQKVACTSKFKDLPVPQLSRYLNSSSLCVPSELVVFTAVAGWIRAEPETRCKLARELMKTVHFPLMTFKEFKEVQVAKLWRLHELAELYEEVREVFCSNEVEPQSRIYLPKQIIVLTGGDQISEDLGNRRLSREVWFGNSLMNHTGIRKAMEWRLLGEMPDPARFCHEAAVLKGKLYVFGGKKYYGTEDTLKSVYRYDLLQNSWERMADMTNKKGYFSVVVLGDHIYAIGGRCHPDYTDSVECFSPAANSWSFVRPLDQTLAGHVAKVSRGQIFISGGLNSDHCCLASLFVYHPEKGSIYLANMSGGRAHHCMETLDDRLYVMGGITQDNKQTAIDQLACEAYDPDADCWTAFSALPVPHVGAGSAVLEGKLYVLGGYSQEDYSDTKMVHRYDPALRKWENMGKMPGPNNDLRASVLFLPPHVRT
ncbi:kelch-like protein 33 [Corythoichthys intestinalis]|uniref:kelch-like protein 33 n=1 Tax=Corythoichthys intestinalis TaxID=161448 RepID=UPI0025A59825|nr:kelch-like protein 33 [Corythoichthys intestinalis]XP_061810895.1 kelch-like protein 33 [Nerophis lumbriciformis]